MNFSFSPKGYYTFKNINDFMTYILANHGARVKIIHRGDTKSIEYIKGNTVVCEWSINVNKKIRMRQIYCKLSNISKIESLIICKLWLKYRKPVTFNSSTCSSGNCIGKFLSGLSIVGSSCNPATK